MSIYFCICFLHLGRAIGNILLLTNRCLIADFGLCGPAEPVDVVDVERPLVDRERVGEVGRGDAPGAEDGRVGVDAQLGDVGAEDAEHHQQ